MSATTLTRFTGTDGSHHRIMLLAGASTWRQSGRNGKVLCDEWEGYGLRLLCLLSTREGDNAPQIEAVIREYRVDACLADHPLSRLVKAEELAESALVSAGCQEAV